MSQIHLKDKVMSTSETSLGLLGNAKDHQYLVVRIAADGEGTECECVLSGQTGDWRMLAGGI